MKCNILMLVKERYKCTASITMKYSYVFSEVVINYSAARKNPLFLFPEQVL